MHIQHIYIYTSTCMYIYLYIHIHVHTIINTRTYISFMYVNYIYICIKTTCISVQHPVAGLVILFHGFVPKIHKLLWDAVCLWILQSPARRSVEHTFLICVGCAVRNHLFFVLLLWASWKHLAKLGARCSPWGGWPTQPYIAHARNTNSDDTLPVKCPPHLRWLMP